MALRPLVKCVCHPFLNVYRRKQSRIPLSTCDMSVTKIPIAVCTFLLGKIPKVNVISSQLMHPLGLLGSRAISFDFLDPPIRRVLHTKCTSTMVLSAPNKVAKAKTMVYKCYAKSNGNVDCKS